MNSEQSHERHIDDAWDELYSVIEDRQTLVDAEKEYNENLKSCRDDFLNELSATDMISRLADDGIQTSYLDRDGYIYVPVPDYYDMGSNRDDKYNKAMNTYLDKALKLENDNLERSEVEEIVKEISELSPEELATLQALINQSFDKRTFAITIALMLSLLYIPEQFLNVVDEMHKIATQTNYVLANFIPLFAHYSLSILLLLLPFMVIAYLSYKLFNEQNNTMGINGKQKRKEKRMPQEAYYP